VSVGATSDTAGITVEAIALGIQRFLEERTKTSVAANQDLFASGLVSSMFAMELVVHLEQAYAVAILGPDLKLDNFRTIERMTAMVSRLLDPAPASSA
jgi:methoxymalonate biosynthesis acyl carrier protein